LERAGKASWDVKRQKICIKRSNQFQGSRNKGNRNSVRWRIFLSISAFSKKYCEEKGMLKTVDVNLIRNICYNFKHFLDQWIYNDIYGSLNYLTAK
jgi:hypothetical protein